MALKDRDRRIGPPRLKKATIGLGYKQEMTRNGKTFTVPVAADHFVFHPDKVPELLEKYGNKCRELPIMFPFSKIEDNFDAYYMVWANKVPLCKGDGDIVLQASPMDVRHRTKSNGETVTSVYNAGGDNLIRDGVAVRDFEWGGEVFNPGDVVQCSGGNQDLYPQCAACSKCAQLRFLLNDSELIRLVAYQISTGSGRNYDHVRDTLRTIAGDGPRPNSIAGIPFLLQRVKGNSTWTDPQGKKHSKEAWFLELEPDPATVRMLYAMRLNTLLGGGNGGPGPLMIEAPADIEAPDDVVESEYTEVDEFDPPPVADEPVAVSAHEGDEIPPEEPPEMMEEPPHDDEMDPALAATIAEAVAMGGEVIEQPAEKEESNGGAMGDPDWIQNPERIAKFFMHAAEKYALDEGNILQALGVEELRDYSGTPRDALKALDTFTAAVAN